MKPTLKALPRALRFLPIAGAVLLATSAQAQMAPYYLDASQAIRYDSNLFRASTNEQSDIISTTSVTLGFDQPISRQRLFGHATGRYNLYRDNDQLNAPGYDIGAGINWEAASKLSGHALVNFSQNQAAFENYGALQQTQSGENLERVSLLDLRAQYGGQSLLSVEALGNFTRVDYSNSAFTGRELETRMLGVGAGYRPNSDWQLGVRYRRTNGEYAGGASDEYDRDDFDLTAQYQASGFSSLSARVSHTKEDHELQTTRDFSGVTGEVRWDYRPTGKLRLGASLARETGAGTSISAASGSTPGRVVPLPGAVPLPSEGAPTAPSPVVGAPGTAFSTGPGYLSDSQLSSRVGLQLGYEATAKILLGLTASYSRDTYDTGFVTGGVTTPGESKGNSRVLLLTAGYQVTRVWSAGCGVGREERNTGVLLAGNTRYAYDATTAYCSVRLSLR